RRAGDHRIAGPLAKCREDAVEVLAGVGKRLERKREPSAHRPHHLDVETGEDAAVHDVERRGGGSRQEGGDAGVAGGGQVTCRRTCRMSALWRPPSRLSWCWPPRSPRWRS